MIQTNYLQEILASKNSMIEEHILKKKWISENEELIDEVRHNVKSARFGMYSSPILIAAPTGSGKTTFALNKLSQIAQEQQGSVLFLSNRAALIAQQKNIKKTSKMPTPSVSSESLDEVYIFENVILMTYQKFFRGDFLNELTEELHIIRCIVLDEAHFFLSDAPFNSYTKDILERIQGIKKAMRIYITATPEEVEQLIAHLEYNIHINEENSKKIGLYCSSDQVFNGYTLKKYSFPVSYDYVTLKFFSDWNMIESLVKQSSDKWMIFVSSKKEGKVLQKKLGDEIAEYIDADTKFKESMRLQSLVRRKKFSSKALICTSVLDSGINIEDLNVKYIVIDTVNSVQAKQMLGRKRHDDHENITLYVRQMNKKDILNIYTNSQRRYSELCEYEQGPVVYLQNNWGNIPESFQKAVAMHICRIDNQYSAYINFMPNPCYRYKLSIDIGSYQEILDAMEEDDDAFPKIVCSWFGKEFDPAMKQEQDDYDKEIEADFFQQNKEAIDRFLRENGLLENKGEMIFDSDGIQKLNEGLKTFKEVLKGNEAKNLIRYEKDIRRVKASINALFDYNSLPHKLEKKGNIWKVVPKE